MQFFIFKKFLPLGHDINTFSLHHFILLFCLRFTQFVLTALCFTVDLSPPLLSMANRWLRPEVCVFVYILLLRLILDLRVFMSFLLLCGLSIVLCIRCTHCSRPLELLLGFVGFSWFVISASTLKSG